MQQTANGESIELKTSVKKGEAKPGNSGQTPQSPGEI
jgi:hypothetical protein